MSQSPEASAPNVWPLLTSAHRVFTTGVDSEAVKARLRAAGMTTESAPDAADAVGLLDAVAGQHHDRPLALLVSGAPWPGSDAGLARSQLAALGSRVGWRVSLASDGLLVMTLGTDAPARMRWVGSRDAPAMRVLFRNMFGHEMSVEHWCWKYSAGNGSGLALWINGEMVAHYGGATRQVRVFGDVMQACQVCDVMVSPAGRAALARRGPLAYLTATFLEHQIGHGLPHAIGFGFPSERAFRVAQRLGLYVAVDEIVSLHWPALSSAASPARRGDWRVRAAPLDLTILHEGTRPWRRAEDLWATMAAAFRGSVLGERSPAWLRKRYGQRPDFHYDALLLTSKMTARWLGIVVTRAHDDYLEIVDLIGAPRHFAALVHVARGVAATKGLHKVQAWITASHAHLLRTSDDADVVMHKPGIRVPFNAHTSGLDPALFVGKWFLMSGDSDFR